MHIRAFPAKSIVLSALVCLQSWISACRANRNVYWLRAMAAVFVILAVLLLLLHPFQFIDARPHMNPPNLNEAISTSIICSSDKHWWWDCFRAYASQNYLSNIAPSGHFLQHTRQRFALNQSAEKHLKHIWVASNRPEYLFQTERASYYRKLERPHSTSYFFGTVKVLGIYALISSLAYDNERMKIEIQHPASRRMTVTGNWWGVLIKVAMQKSNSLLGRQTHDTRRVTCRLAHFMKHFFCILRYACWHQ